MAIDVSASSVGFGLYKRYSIYLVKSIVTLVEMVSAIINSHAW